MDSSEKVVIIGAGLCGSLLALRLAQRGYKVAVYEERPDLRTNVLLGGRSINLAFSARGIKAFELVGLAGKTKPLCIPMYGRMIHDVQGNTFLSPYSSDKLFINSVSRSDLNALLLDELDTFDAVEVYFNHKCLGVNIDENTAVFEFGDKQISIEANVLFGTDGAGSVLRKARQQQDIAFKVHQELLSHNYKELSIPAQEGSFQIEKEALHIWPRGTYMLIALANVDGSFTVTLFLPKEGSELSFEALDTEDKVRAFFETKFPDALNLMPNLVHEFFENPTGILGTIKCNPWQYKGKSILLGDAAHAVVPFYGQGMNASFEDVLILDKYLDKYSNDWEQVFKAFQKERKQDADAIADLALENFYEMRDHVANVNFQQKRKLEMQLEATFDYYSKYAMVTFQSEIPYHKAQKIGNRQDEILLEIVEENKGLSLETIYHQIKKETAKL